MNSTAKNIGCAGISIVSWGWFFRVYTQKWYSGSYHNSIFNFVRNHHTVSLGPTESSQIKARWKMEDGRHGMGTQNSHMLGSCLSLSQSPSGIHKQQVPLLFPEFTPGFSGWNPLPPSAAHTSHYTDLSPWVCFQVTANFLILRVAACWASREQEAFGACAIKKCRGLCSLS
jgi:hypothetical protein